MAKYKVKNNSKVVYISRKGLKKDPINDIEFNIFEKNYLTGLFKPEKNKKGVISYKAPQSIVLSKYLKKNFNVHKLYSVLAQSLEIKKKVEKYHLNPDRLVYSIDVAHVNEITGEVYFLYEPILSQEKVGNLFTFVGEVIRNSKCANDLNGISETEKFNKELDALRAFLLNPQHTEADLEKLIENRFPQIYQQISRTGTGQSGLIASRVLSSIDISNDEGTVLLNAGNNQDDEETVLLSNSQVLNAELVREKTGEVIIISKSDFVIGKSRDCDYTIMNNTAVSRKHISIKKTGNIFYVQDLGSTNGTQVQGTRLQSNDVVQLNDGSILQIADEKFDFYIR